MTRRRQCELRFGLLGPPVLYCTAAPDPHDPQEPHDPQGTGVPYETVRSPKVRALLAALLLDAGRVVPVETLKEILWGGAPPASAHASLHNHVTRLRRLLDDPERLRAVPPGYQLRVAQGELDVHLYDRHIAAARGAYAARNWERVVRECAAALALWRGTPLSGLPSELGGYAFAQRLSEARLLLLEWRYDAELALGGSRLDRIVPELTALAAEHPLREAYHRQLMLALYRTGRRAEALAVHRDLRTRLVEDLGIEPGPAVREAHVEVLRSPEEETRTTTVSTPPAASAAPVTPPPDIRRPAQLPPPPAHFTGRDAPLRLLEHTLTASDGTPVVVISGMAGVGKTALALQLAHALKERFTSGQLYLNLHGATPGMTPLPVCQALAALLRDLGTEPRHIPEHPDAAAALLRTLLAPTRTLLVLDDAATAAQIRPLLPGGPDCAVIVTSRSPLTALDGAHRLPLGPLTGEESARLLRAASGRGPLTAPGPASPVYPTELTSPVEPTGPIRPASPVEPTGPTGPTGPASPFDPTEPSSPTEPIRPANPVDASRPHGTPDPFDAPRPHGTPDPFDAPRPHGTPDPLDTPHPLDATHPLIALTGRLPLALRIVAARLAARRALTPDALARQLAAAESRLYHLEYDDLSVRRSLAVAHDGLAASARRTDRDAALALRHIGALDLPAYGAPLLARLTGTDERHAEAALDRLVDVALLEETAYGRYVPHDLVRDFARELVGTRDAGAAAETALHWYAARAEHVLTAIVAPGLDRDDRRRPTTAQPAAHEEHVRAVPPFDGPEAAFAWGDAELENIVALVESRADASGDAPLVSTLLRLLFPYLHRRGRVAEMEMLGRTALRTARRLGDEAAEAYALGDLAGLHFLTGRQKDALALNGRALVIWRRLGRPSWIRRCLNNRGLLLENLGRYDESGAALRQSLEYSRQLDDPYGEAVTHSHLGNLYEHTDPRAAIEQHRRSLALGEEIGAVIVRHSAHCNIGYAHLSLGEPAAALPHFEESLRILGGHGDWHGESQTRLGAVRALRLLGRTERALGECAELLRRAETRADRYTGGLARHQYGLLLVERGRPDEAYEEWRRALAALDGTDATAVVRELWDLLAEERGQNNTRLTSRPHSTPPPPW
ncbi:BTAD domain-containing putative transcriptional regulator [Streptomyces antibioticus]|uniref:Transcriptional regulator n=1 Tax=Streptomyces antibioticus TaxID=1890 RepID=A0ABX3LI21_STRAT|nr:BTAD domain-containing putative transcriptional regulator [Streptomyces antibioticus]OOQ50409.1 transcriptional regulator [Streptomyces antibioticus]